MTDAEWQRYLAVFHSHQPGVTERVLSRVGGSPYRWLVEPLFDVPGWVVDLACGSAPTRDSLAENRWVGVDLSAGELAAAVAAGRRPVLLARADALPFGDGAVDAVCAAMALQVVTPLTRVLAETERILRPGGVLVALVPARLRPSPRGWLEWARVLRALGITNQRWPNPRACDGLADVLSRHGFAVVSSEHRTFPFPLDSSDSAALLVDSLYVPGISMDRVAAAKRALGSRARPGRSLPVPLRRVVARRQIGVPSQFVTAYSTR
ncbi:class I SAM-dependent methyltransferase [Saccharomonospora halophila]|uniref:class I SAM-dependent methyltransferase n=1 Tax=Saccharomonospora halophila TaxID=129922 RepID=UPI000379E3A2|nr:class I SAM-dependent methyltransferase [Saccharomonospora halophila]